MPTMSTFGGGPVIPLHLKKVVEYYLRCFCFVLSPDIDECASDPCENGANCTNDVNAYNCSCVDGYTGIFCEIGANV